MKEEILDEEIRLNYLLQEIILGEPMRKRDKRRDIAIFLCTKEIGGNRVYHNVYIIYKNNFFINEVPPALKVNSFIYRVLIEFEIQVIISTFKSKATLFEIQYGENYI